MSILFHMVFTSSNSTYIGMLVLSILFLIVFTYPKSTYILEISQQMSALLKICCPGTSYGGMYTFAITPKIHSRTHIRKIQKCQSPKDELELWYGTILLHSLAYMEKPYHCLPLYNVVNFSSILQISPLSSWNPIEKNSSENVSSQP